MSRTTRRLLIVLVVLAIVVPVAALASDRFTDVPDSNVFHDDITWLADAAVTLGCNPPANDEFCPDDFVTREQMAAFMKRLAENQVVDAGFLEGKTAADLASILVHDSETDSVSFPGDFGVITIESVTVTASAGSGGAVLVAAGGDLVGNGATVEESRSFACWISTDPASTSSNLGAHITFADNAPISSNVISDNFSTSHALVLAAGESATFYLLCRDIAGNDGNLFRVSNGHISATFLPGEGHVVVTPEP